MLLGPKRKWEKSYKNKLGLMETRKRDSYVGGEGTTLWNTTTMEHEREIFTKKKGLEL